MPPRTDDERSTEGDDPKGEGGRGQGGGGVGEGERRGPRNRRLEACDGA